MQSFIALIEDKPEHDYNCLPDGGSQPELSALLRTAAGLNCQNIIHKQGHYKASVLPKYLLQAFKHCTHNWHAKLVHDLLFFKILRDASSNPDRHSLQAW